MDNDTLNDLLRWKTKWMNDNKGWKTTAHVTLDDHLDYLGYSFPINKKEDINMEKIFEWQVDPKGCKYYIDAYDVIFLDDQHELRFGRYSDPSDARLNDKCHMAVKHTHQIFDYVTKDRALCFYDIDRHRWCSKVDERRLKCWEVIRPDDNIFINVLVGIAIDEISGSKTDLSVDDITHRIKSRFGIWFDEYTNKRSWDSRNTIKVPDNFFDNNDVKLYFDNKPVHINTSIKVDKRPHPKFVMYNNKGPGEVYTTVVWKDGSHTVVKCANGDEYDEEKAVMYAIIKHMCNDNGCEMGRYFEEFFDHEITHGD